MSEKNNIQLSDDELQKVSGGTPGAVPKLENYKACNSFICNVCGRDHDHHTIIKSQLVEWVCTSADKLNWSKEWRDDKLDCNHCQYFVHINGSSGECRKDCQ